MSTLDLINNQWLLLLTTPSDATLEETGFPVKVQKFLLNSDITSSESNLFQLYGLQEGQSILIRPDGYIAWKGSQQTQAIQDALRSALYLK